MLILIKPRIKIWQSVTPPSVTTRMQWTPLSMSHRLMNSELYWLPPVQCVMAHNEPQVNASNCTGYHQSNAWRHTMSHRLMNIESYWLPQVQCVTAHRQSSSLDLPTPSRRWLHCVPTWKHSKARPQAIDIMVAPGRGGECSPTDGQC